MIRCQSQYCSEIENVGVGEETVGQGVRVYLREFVGVLLMLYVVVQAIFVGVLRLTVPVTTGN